MSKAEIPINIYVPDSDRALAFQNPDEKAVTIARLEIRRLIKGFIERNLLPNNYLIDNLNITIIFDPEMDFNGGESIVEIGGIRATALRDRSES